MKEFRVLHVGFDGLDIAFMGAMRQEDLAAMAVAKDKAQMGNHDELIFVGPGRVPMHVAGTGARGGYAYRTDTGPDGETWFFKRSTELEDWNIRVSVKSLPLATLGYWEVKARLFRRLKAMGARVLQESVSRVDVAADFLAPDFQLEPEQFVSHWRARRSIYAPGKVAKVSDEEVRINYSGRRASSVTIGTMPNRQVIVYDKRREAIDQRKGHWFEIWGIPKDDPSLRVWRVEVRAGKNYLNDFSLKTLADLEAMGTDILRSALGAVRYLDPADHKSNVSRRRDHVLWNQARAAMSGVLEESFAGTSPSKIKAATRREFQNLYRSLMSGFAASYSVALGLDAARPEDIARKISGDIAAFIRENSDKFADSRARAEDRLYFLNEGENGECGYDGDCRPSPAIRPGEIGIDAGQAGGSGTAIRAIAGGDHQSISAHCDA